MVCAGCYGFVANSINKQIVLRNLILDRDGIFVMKETFFDSL